ncbi:hypothetical protein [Neisseria sp. GT4A_CT1]|nr:hypothetical protein [Neisseria sp. GT4A_CT1]
MSDGSRQHSGRGRECQKGRLKHKSVRIGAKQGFQTTHSLKHD